MSQSKSPKPCGRCHGTGHWPSLKDTCVNCRGMGFHPSNNTTEPCPTCNGGEVKSVPLYEGGHGFPVYGRCPTCHSTGHIEAARATGASKPFEGTGEPTPDEIGIVLEAMATTPDRPKETPQADKVIDLQAGVLHGIIEQIVAAHWESVNRIKATCPCIDCGKWRLYSGDINGAKNNE